MFLHQPPHTPAAERRYQSDRATAGHVMNLTRVWAWRPDLTAAFGAAPDAPLARAAPTLVREAVRFGRPCATEVA